MKRSVQSWGTLLTAAGALLFSVAQAPLEAMPRKQPSVEMQVSLPPFVQIIMAAGDRYLAANLAGFRTLVASSDKMGPENYRVQARVQSDAARFNPAHGDNYYLAAALLPWNGQVEAAQFILKSATEARPFDWQPPFYFGFNLLHFLKRPDEAALWLRRAASHTGDDLQALQLQQMAGRWVATGEDIGFAIRLHRAMAKETRHKAFAAFLENRASRLENLMRIDEAAKRFRDERGRFPGNLEEIREGGYLASVPIDPFGAVYGMDSSGKPVVHSPGQR